MIRGGNDAVLYGKYKFFLKFINLNFIKKKKVRGSNDKLQSKIKKKIRGGFMTKVGEMTPCYTVLIIIFNNICIKTYFYCNIFIKKLSKLKKKKIIFFINR